MGLKKEMMLYNFPKIHFLMLLLGFPLLKLEPQPTSSIQQFLESSWPTISMIFKTFVQVLGLIFGYFLLPRKPFISISIFACQAAVLNLTIFCKRIEIRKAMYNIQKISHKLNQDRQAPKMKINLFIIGMIAFMAFYFYVFLRINSFKKNISARNEKLSILTQFGLSESTWQYIGSTCVFIGIHISTAIYGVVYILCKTFYMALNDIIKKYTRKLQSRLDTVYVKDISKKSNEIHNLHTVAKIVDKADRAINISSFQLLAVFFSEFFSLVMSTPVMNSTTSPVILAYWTVTAIVYTGLFTMLVFSASSVRENGKILRQAAMEYSDALCGRPPHLNMVPLMIFLQSAKELDLGVTGGNMFYIEKGIFLTVGSAMVTYGVIFYQMG